MIVKRVCLLTFVGGCVGEGLVNWDGRNCNTRWNLYLSLQADERAPAAARPARFLSTQSGDKQASHLVELREAVQRPPDRASATSPRAASARAN